MNVADMPKRMSLDDFVRNRHWVGVSEVEIGSFFRALHTAVNKHHTQKRISGGNYYEHLLVTADILNRLGFDIEVQKAGLLHDVMEDCGMSFEELRRYFGVRVADMVHANSKDKQNPKGYWEQLYLGTELHFETIFIKMVDRWHNLVTVYSLRDLNRRIRFLEETVGPFSDTLTRCRPLIIPTLHLADYDELTVKIYSLAQEKLIRTKRKLSNRLNK
ncbi:MAG: HD domain-containing protein [Patescibacteria group bacterium]|nr:HD domain-containing protein [Patescibacteria group bacterium]